MFLFLPINMVFVVAILLILAAWIEATLLPVPFALLGLILLAGRNRKWWVFLLAIVVGVFLDSLTFRTLGISSLFFLLAIGAVFVYSRKFQTTHALFSVIFGSLVGGVYLLLFDFQEIVLLFVLTVLVATLLFGA